MSGPVSGGSAREPAPWELLDDGFPVPEVPLLVIGCGNPLRGDDALGPVVIRRLFDEGVPQEVALVDGGTAGMDVAFRMRGAQRVVIVDAARTGAEPGTIYRVPAEELAALPSQPGLNLHAFRWDHALSFGHWLLGPHLPSDITVYLVESASLDPDAPLSPPVDRAATEVIALLRRDHFASLHP
ncbi:MAG: hydrogenase maturation protease [Mobilicoccus sp.]|nr:hydrogenase maturation protease [Mobilicoccus sp.]